MNILAQLYTLCLLHVISCRRLKRHRRSRRKVSSEETVLSKTSRWEEPLCNRLKQPHTFSFYGLERRVEASTREIHLVPDETKPEIVKSLTDIRCIVTCDEQKIYSDKYDLGGGFTVPELHYRTDRTLKIHAVFPNEERVRWFWTIFLGKFSYNTKLGGVITFSTLSDGPTKILAGKINDPLLECCDGAVMTIDPGSGKLLSLKLLGKSTYQTMVFRIAGLPGVAPAAQHTPPASSFPAGMQYNDSTHSVQSPGQWSDQLSNGSPDKKVTTKRRTFKIRWPKYVLSDSRWTKVDHKSVSIMIIGEDVASKAVEKYVHGLGSLLGEKMSMMKGHVELTLVGSSTQSIKNKLTRFPGTIQKVENVRDEGMIQEKLENMSGLQLDKLAFIVLCENGQDAGGWAQALLQDKDLRERSDKVRVITPGIGKSLVLDAEFETNKLWKRVGNAPKKAVEALISFIVE